MMHCTPPQYPSERCAIEPLIQCLAVLEDRTYRFVSLLDEENRNSPQPEALYEDEATGSKLVIERKSLVYPENYVQLHKYDHDIINILSSLLPKKVSAGPYVLEFGYLHEGRFPAIQEQANDLANAIKDRITELIELGSICLELNGLEYSLHKKTPSDHNDMEPWDSLVIRFGRNLPRYNPLIPPLSGYLEAEIARVFEAARGKFEHYEGDRRILLINRYGDARRTQPRDWRMFFREFQDEIPVDEIWDAWIETPDYSETSYWIHDRFYPCVDPDINVADDIWIPCRCFNS